MVLLHELLRRPLAIDIVLQELLHKDYGAIEFDPRVHLMDMFHVDMFHVVIPILQPVRRMEPALYVP